MTALTFMAALAAALMAGTPAEPGFEPRPAYDLYCVQTGSLNAYTQRWSPSYAHDEGGLAFFILDRRSGAFSDGQTGSAAFITDTGRFSLHQHETRPGAELEGAAPGQALLYHPRRGNAGLAIRTRHGEVRLFDCEDIDPPVSSPFAFGRFGRPLRGG
ncbi:MAG: hypothetical protein JJU18_08205 [Oceanicaulis sp.]|nr:hypothetical protein [Oceanicaulis sp.]